MTPETIKRNVQFVARQLGFDDCRISAAQRAPHADNYLNWVEQGHAGDMLSLIHISEPTRRP